MIDEKGVRYLSKNNNSTKKCPYCKEDIGVDAKKCPKCQSDLRSWLGRHKILAGFFLLVILVFILIISTAEGPSTSQYSDMPISKVKSMALEDVPYDDLVRNNNDYVGKIVHYKAEVAQINKRYNDKYILRVYVTKSEYNSWENDVWVEYEGKRLVEKDIIDLWGEVVGLKEYETVLRASRTIPKTVALHVETNQ